MCSRLSLGTFRPQTLGRRAVGKMVGGKGGGASGGLVVWVLKKNHDCAIWKQHNWPPCVEVVLFAE